MDLCQYYEVMKITEHGKKYIDFSMKNSENQEKKLSEYISHNPYTLLDFWASWGKGQEKNYAQLVNIYHEYHKKGLEIVGFSLDTDEEAWKKAIAEKHLSWPQFCDLKGTQSTLYQQYSHIGFQTSFLIDQQGNIIGKFKNIDEFSAKIKELMDK